jgi:hypothetical protein
MKTNTIKFRLTSLMLRRSLVLVLILLAIGPAFSQTDFQDLADGVDAFSAQLADSLPLNSAQGLNWSSAYIGQLLGIPPHFGVGISAGVTMIKAEKLSALTDAFGVSMPIEGMFPNPGYTVEGRIGGFVLPFDVGLKVGYIPPVGPDEFQLEYFLMGGDFRYALLEGDVALPELSLGVGVNYLSGGILAKIGDITFNWKDVNSSLNLKSPSLDFSWETLSFELKAQISKSVLIVTPGLGIGINYAKTKAGYTATTELTANGKTLDDFAREFGVKFDGDNGFSSIKEISGFGMRLFGGISFNLAVIRIDITAQAATGNNFNFGALSYGAGLAVRFQL